MKDVKLKVSILILLFVNSLTIIAQDELQAFDRLGEVFTLTPELEQKVSVFNGNGTFKSAQLFKKRDSVYVIEYQYELNGRVFRNERQITDIELERIRTVLSDTNGAKALLNTEGRGLMLTSGIALGPLYGGSLASVADMSEFRVSLGLFMLGAGASFFGPYMATKDCNVTYGQANLYTYGISRGYAHGALLANSLFDNPDASGVSLMSMLTGIGEAAWGYNFVKRKSVGNGTANLMTVYGDFGFFAGFALANQFNLLENNGRATCGLVAASSIGGLMAGYHFGEGQNISAGDAEIIYTTAALGVFLPLSMVVAVDPKQNWAYTTPSLITGIGGLCVGHYLTKNVDVPFWSGYITKLGTVAGGLVGLGGTYIFFGESDKAWPYLLGSYIGAQTAFALLYKMNLRSNSSKQFSRLNFRFSPENYFFERKLTSSNHARTFLPLAGVSYRF